MQVAAAVQAEDEGDWVFTGGDGKERGPYSLAQLRKLLSRCGSWLQQLYMHLQGSPGAHARAVRPMQYVLHLTSWVLTHCAGCRGMLKATDMLHDEEAGVSIQVCL